MKNYFNKRSNVKVRIGIDAGGTFTDVYLVDSQGKQYMHKLPSTPGQPSNALISGILDILRISNYSPSEIDFLGFGTTVSTNALLEHKGANTGLITTFGFRDILEIGRQTRPHVYNLFASKNKTLVARNKRLEVKERTEFDGRITTEASVDDVIECANKLIEEGAESIAICFINSYINPANEATAAQAIRERWPNIHVSASHEISPEFREFERLSSVVINAYLMPGTKSYLDEFENKIKDLDISAKPLFMNSAGGVVTPQLAAKRPIDTLFSGPSGGISAAQYIAKNTNKLDIITFDMGGTSTDVCMIRGGEPEITHERNINGSPVRATAIDVHTVGSGGSSIAWIDDGGMLHVGPESAGANPGSACYGKGGDNPTVTDANVVLGRLHPEYLLGGRLKINKDLAIKAIDEKIAKPKGMTVDEAAMAILELSNHSIAQAVRHVSVEQGLDPQSFQLMAFGGAGPLHAASVARELGICEVLIPESPGVLCAMGVLAKDVRVDSGQTRILNENNPDFLNEIEKTARIVEADIENSLRLQGYSFEEAVVNYSFDMRYEGQNYELNVSYDNIPCSYEAWDKLRTEFNLLHKRQYGHCSNNKNIQLVNLRISAIVKIQNSEIIKKEHIECAALPNPKEHRDAFFVEHYKYVNTPVYDRSDLRFGNVVIGPAIIEQMDTTTVIPPLFKSYVDNFNNIVISLVEDR